MSNQQYTAEDRAAAIEHATRLGWFDPAAAVARLEESHLDTTLLRGVVEWEATGSFPGREMVA